MDIKYSLYSGMFVLVSSLLASFSAQAALLNSSYLPAAIQRCETSANCSADIANHLDLPGMTAIKLTRYNTGSAIPTQSWLLRYNLYAPAANTYWKNFSMTRLGTTTVTPYTGNIWMEAPNNLNSWGRSLLNIYTDQMSPDPARYSPVMNSTLVFSMLTVDIMNGGASYYNSGNNGSGEPITTRGSLGIVDGIRTCIECTVDVSLNLIGLDYSTGSASFNPGDRRTRLLHYADFFPTHSSDRSFNVSPVPLPASIGLFASGLLGLLQLARKKHSG